MLSIVVSVVLFFLSLLIFFSVRSSDKKESSNSIEMNPFTESVNE